ncbi:MAG: sigma-70 family RNA polymerase sigma factor [Deltaproteobacteria bacterium]|nr:sigma-70 family RNA polymerase sigma factor [Deltaproteobacteria bacterium]
MTPGAAESSGRIPAAMPPPGVAPAVIAESPSARLRRLFEQHFDFIWRSLRRFGLNDDRADDAAQQVFLVASRKLDAIAQESERSFLFGTALRVASDIRRSAHVRREIAHAEVGVDLDGGPRPDELLDQRRARDLLDRVLDEMELEMRTVFVLYEIEEMTTSEIASLLEIPHGTVASRLRRAREDFEARIQRVRTAGRAKRGEP